MQDYQQNILAEEFNLPVLLHILDRRDILYYNVFEKLRWHVMAKYCYAILFYIEKSSLMDSYEVTYESKSIL